MTVLPQASDGMALAPVVKADGAELSDAFVNALLDLRVRRALRTIGRCTLRFVDPGFTLASKGTFKVGVEVHVAAKGITSGSSTTTVFEGKVTSIGVEQHDGGQPELVVLAEDLAYELSRSSRAATYLDRKASDMITALVTAIGARASVAATSATLDYTLQTDSDLAFVDELCRRNGFDWEVDGTTFHAWKSPALGGTAPGPGVTLTVGETLRSFSAKVHADAPASVTVRGWDHLNKKEVLAESTPRRSDVPPGLAKLAPASGVKKAKVLDSQANPVNPADAKTLAGVDAAATGAVLARGESDITPGLRPGVTVTVRDAGPASGSYYVREVEHVFRPAGFHTTFIAGDREQVTILGDDRGVGARSHAHSPRPRGRRGERDRRRPGRRRPRQDLAPRTRPVHRVPVGPPRGPGRRQGARHRVPPGGERRGPGRASRAATSDGRSCSAGCSARRTRSRRTWRRTAR